MLKTSDITVAVGALGAPIHLDGKESRFNGSSQFRSLIYALCKNPSISRVVILGMFGKESSNPKVWEKVFGEDYKKICYPTKAVHDLADAHWGKDKTFPSYREPDENGNREYLAYDQTRPYQDLYMKYVLHTYSIDFGLFFVTQGWCGTNINGLVRKKTDSSQYRLQLPMAAKNAGPFVHTINNGKFPYYLISTDDRVVTSMARHDTIHMPVSILGQWNNSYEWDTLDSYDNGVDMTTKKLEVVYAQTEKLNAIGLPLVDPATDRKERLTVVANQTTHRNDLTCPRFSELKNWILDIPAFKNISIYGEWSPAYISGYEESNSSKEEHDKLIAYNKKYNDISTIPAEEVVYPQFKGRVSPQEIDSVMQNTRYTLCLPVIDGYLTWKVLEALANGVVPFIPPMYDSQCNLIPSDCFLRVANPQEFLAKVCAFENNPEARIKFVRHYQKLWLSACYDGSFICSELNKHFKKDNIELQLL